MALLVVLFVGSCASDPPSKVRQLSAATYSNESGAQSQYSGDETVIRVLLVADEGYRTERMQWAPSLREQTRAASQQLQQFGVRLEIVDVQPWSHDGRGETLDDTLTALARQHPDPDVDRVIGFVGSTATATRSHSELGRAYVMGQHLVVRAMNDAKEREYIEEELEDELGADAEKIYTDRVRHKEITVLLHEIGHSFGAVHASLPRQIMSPTYHHQANEFTTTNVLLLNRSFELRGSTSTEEEWAEAYRADVPDLTTGQRDLDVIDVKSLQTVHEDRAKFDALSPVRELWEVRKLEEGWSLLEPQMKDYATDAMATQLACRFTSELKHPDTERWCLSSLVLNENDVFANQALIDAAIDAKKWKVAAGRIDKLRSIDEAESLGAAGSISGFYIRAGALSDALEVLDGLAGEAAAQNRRYVRQQLNRNGLAGEPRTKQMNVMAVARPLAEALEKKDYETARKLASTQTLSEPRRALFSCRVALDENANAAIAKHCSAAVRSYPEAAEALYGAGFTELVEGDEKAALALWRRGLEVDKKQQFFWRVLSDHYKANGASGELEKLRGEYKAEFGREPNWK